MTDGEHPETVRDLYYQALSDLAGKYGDDYARLVAAQTMASLLSMVSMATYRLSLPPLFVPPEPAPSLPADE